MLILSLIGKKFHFMITEGIVLGHKVSGAGLEVDKAKINVILKLLPPTNIKDPPYTYQWAEKTVPVAEGSSETTTERYMKNYKNVLQDIRDQLNVEAEAVQIILTGIDNDIYSTVDACPNACEMWKSQ
ncbi:hypothetical protein Tco_0686933 [Tanacetum coccineum]